MDLTIVIIAMLAALGYVFLFHLLCLCQGALIPSCLQAYFIITLAQGIIVNCLIKGDGVFILLLLSQILYTLISFIYFLCVVGPYETSLRMHLIRLLGRNPSGLSREEIRQMYSAQTLLEVRLGRLQAAGDIQILENRIKAVPKTNAFLGIDMVARMLRACYGLEAYDKK